MGKYFLFILLLCITISFGQQKKDSLSLKSKFDTVICEKKEIDYKILRVIPDPSIDYKIMRYVPGKSIDYKIMRITPNLKSELPIYQFPLNIDTLKMLDGLPKFKFKLKDKKK